MLTRRDDGTYRLSNRFWAMLVFVIVFNSWIMWNTQQARNETERQAQYTTQFAAETQACLNSLIVVLNERVSYNDNISELDLQRQKVWEDLVTQLATISPNLQVVERGQRAQEVLDRFFEANSKIKAAQAANAEERAKRQYPEPDCGQNKPK